MKSRLVSTLAAAGLLSSAAGCISFKTAPPPSPENRLERAVACKRVETSGGLFVPRDEAEAFGPADKSVIFLVRLRDVGREAKLRWKWYAPDGTLARDAGDVSVNPEGRFMDVVTAYDVLEMMPRPPGSWTVAVFLDGILLASKTFEAAAERQIP